MKSKGAKMSNLDGNLDALDRYLDEQSKQEKAKDVLLNCDEMVEFITLVETLKTKALDFEGYDFLEDIKIEMREQI